MQVMMLRWKTVFSTGHIMVILFIMGIMVDMILKLVRLGGVLVRKELL